MSDLSRPLLQQAPSTPVEAGPFAALAAVCRDRSRPLLERVDAFEDVVESQVGDSIFTRARNLERELGFGQLWLKFEGDNPSGTQKDRISFAQVLDALRRGYDTVTVASCGNYGVAMALAAGVAGLRCVVLVPERYHTRRIAEMAQLGAEVRRVAGSYEDTVVESRALADAEDWYDANPGGLNLPVQLKGYGEIAYEIYDQLRDAPAAIACPMSNGTTIAGIHRGFVSLNRRGKTSRMPRLIGGSAWRKNPIVTAFRQGLERCPVLDPGRIRETHTNEPLINWYSIDGDPALSAIRASKGHAGDATDRRMKQMSRLLREKQGLHVLPASTAGLIALVDLNATSPLPSDRYVVVLTGRSG